MKAIQIMYYTIYKTTNLVNGKIYIGAHKTRNLDDNYLGSNKVLNRAIKKYGREKFVKETLFILDDEDSMFAKEKELVNEEFVARQDTYNIGEGGRGWSGFGKAVTERGIGIHALTFEERSINSKKVQSNRDPEERKIMCSLGGKRGSASGIKNKTGIHGLSDEERSINAKLGPAKQKELGVGFHDSKVQSENGKRGGPKNKGFVWYTDGVNDYKYTTKEQADKSFDIFLLENPQYSSGRSYRPKSKRPNIVGKRKFVTNGYVNKQVNIDALENYLKENSEFRLGKTTINKTMR